MRIPISKRTMGRTMAAAVVATFGLSALLFAMSSNESPFVYSNTGGDQQGLRSEQSYSLNVMQSINNQPQQQQRRRLQEEGEEGEQGGDEAAAPVKQQQSAAIATLVSNTETDVDSLCRVLQTLVFIHGDTLERPRAPVLVFNEKLSHVQMAKLRACTDRVVEFHEVQFQHFPKGFDRFKEEENGHLTGVPYYKSGELEEGKSTWGYHQMIRFWTSGVWRHPAIREFDTIMRIDADMCVWHGISYPPHMPNPHKIYHGFFGGYELDVQYVEGLYDFAKNYMEAEGMEPKNPELWRILEKTMEKKGSLPTFQNKVEIANVEFMTRHDVDKWHSSLTEREPYGVFRHRWSDGVTRFLTMAMFSDPGTVSVDADLDHYEIHHGYCYRPDFDQAIRKHMFKDYAQTFLGLTLFKGKEKPTKLLLSEIAWRR